MLIYMRRPANPMVDCTILLTTASWILAIALSLTTLLFFFRVRAIYLNNKCVTALFFLCWLAVVAGCIVGAQRVGKDEPSGSNSFANPYCISDPIDMVSVVTSMSTIPMINDVLSFIAVTWRITQNSLVEVSFVNGFKVVLLGRYLPALSKALLMDGQFYFL